MSVPGMALPTDVRPDQLVSITYVSSSADLLGERELGELLVAWRAGNTARGLTGVLLYRGGNIVQVLEGPAEVVAGTFSRIAADRRHTGVTVLLHEVIGSRAFPDWSMGYRLVDDDAPRPEGHTDYLSGPRSTTTAAPAGPAVPEVPSAVERVLQVFRDTCR